MKTPLFFTFILCLIFLSSLKAVPWHQKKSHHQVDVFDEKSIKALSSLSNEDSFEKILDKILIVRVPGTNGNLKVRKYIYDTMKNLDWTVELDTFSERTPVGTKEFSNVIATLNPDAPRRLVLACHYDSKLNRESTLLTATDSAVPCAMMIDIAQQLDPYLKKDHKITSDVTLQFIFFDGEEAFVQWTSTDSLYGSRHLAAKWQQQPYPLGNVEKTNELNRIDLFVLLDLLGAPNPTFYNYYPETGSFYKSIMQIEQNLKQLKLLKNHRNNYFQSRQMRAGIEDDHIPFIKRGVPVIHVIPVPFPKVWHRESDNKENLHFPTIDNLNKIVRIFVAEYLHLDMEDSL